MTPQRVLIVEDEPACAATLELALEGLRGIVSLRARTAEAAMEELGRFPVAVIITDIHLPAMSGLELMQWVHQMQPGVPVVVVSASTAASAKGDALQAGAAAFFAKPFSPAAVCQKMLELLKESSDV
ncbi:MAG: response regulator [Bryobacteraceae bacterium]